MKCGARPGAKEPILFSGKDVAVEDRVAQLLRAGGVAAIPTDTVYGLAAAIDRPDAIARLYTIKGRPEAKAIPVLLSDAVTLESVAPRAPELARTLACAFWPGPLTIVVPAAPGLHELITDEIDGGQRTVAVRVPNHALARAIITAAGGALAVTSANLSGMAPALAASDIAALGKRGLDAIVDDGPVPVGQPSTVVSILGSDVEILRRGAVSDGELWRAIDGVKPMGTLR